MDEGQVRMLTKAAKREKDPDARFRMHAVRGIMSGRTVADVADMFIVPEQAVRSWVRVFDESGINGLRDLPGAEHGP